MRRRCRLCLNSEIRQWTWTAMSNWRIAGRKDVQAERFPNIRHRIGMPVAVAELRTRRWSLGLFDGPIY